MVDEITIEVIVDEHELEEAQKNMEVFDKTSTQVIDRVDKSTRESFDQVLNMARSSYIIGMGVVKAFGVSVPYMFRSMISAAFATIAALKAVALGKAMTTMDWFSFSMEMIQLGLATVATVSAQLGQQEIGRSLMGSKMALMGIQSLISNLYFL